MRRWENQRHRDHPFQQENESHLTDQTTKIGLCKSASGINTFLNLKIIKPCLQECHNKNTAMCKIRIGFIYAWDGGQGINQEAHIKTLGVVIF